MITTLAFKISLQDTSFHISIYSLRFYLSAICMLNFLSNFYIPRCLENFQIYGVHVPRKCIDSRNFFLCPSHSKLSPSSCHHALGRRKLLIPQDSIVSKIWFIQQQKGLEETMICFIKSQSENMKMTWNIRFFNILCDLQFFQI